MAGSALALPVGRVRGTLISNELVDAGAEVGLAAAPLESQRDFLLRHGLAGDLAALRRADDERGYERGCALIDAYGHFRVLVQRTSH